MHKKSQLHTSNYFKNEAKKASIILPLLFLATTSFIVSFLTLKDLEWEERISLQRGFFLFSSGALFFPSLFLILNNLQMHTVIGKKFMRTFKLGASDVYDISNKFVSGFQALFCIVSGATSCQYSCKRDILRTSHYISEAYAWFGAAYFFYDIWSMYKVWSTKMTQQSLDGVKNQIALKMMKLAAYLSQNFVIVFHHVFIGGFGFLVITSLRGGLGDCFFGYIFLMESSTPFVSFRGILSKMGLKNSKWYVANGLAMLVTFFIFRVCMFPYVINIYANAINVDFFTAVTTLPRNCLISISLLLFPQMYWFALMIKGASQVLFNNDKLEKISNNNNSKKKLR